MKNWKQKINFIILFLIMFCTILAVKTEHVQAARKYYLWHKQVGHKVGDIGMNVLEWQSGDYWNSLKSKKIKWYTTNKKIIKFKHKGYYCNYKALKPGTCYIYAKYKGKKYKCKVIVFNAKKRNIKKLKVDMKGCINNEQYYSYGCRIYNPNNFAVKTTLYAKVKTKRGDRLENDNYDITIPAKEYKYIAEWDNSLKLEGTSVNVTYRFSSKKPEPANIYYNQYKTSKDVKKVMKVSKPSIRKQPPEEDEEENNYYEVKYKIKNISNKIIPNSKTEIFLIKNKKVVGSFSQENSNNIEPGETFWETMDPVNSYWPFKKWKRVIVVNSYWD